jgi:hypothetical protein
VRGVGWATVDLERTAREIPEVQFGDIVDEPALGARAMCARVGSIDLVLLEPSTEGRLAGWLARNGEGTAVLYVEPTAVAGAQGVLRDPEGATALGRRGRLKASGDRAQPFVIVLDPE